MLRIKNCFFSSSVLTKSPTDPTHATQHFPPNHLPHTRAPRTVQFDMSVMADVTNTHGTHQSTVVKPAHNWERLYMRKNGSAKQFLAFALKFGCISDRPGYTAGHNGYGIFYLLPIEMLELIITMALKDQITAEPKNNKDSAALWSTGALKYYGINKYTAHMVCQDGSPAIDKVSRAAPARPSIRLLSLARGVAARRPQLPQRVPAHRGHPARPPARGPGGLGGAPDGQPRVRPPEREPALQPEDHAHRLPCHRAAPAACARLALAVPSPSPRAPASEPHAALAQDTFVEFGAVLKEATSLQVLNYAHLHFPYGPEVIDLTESSDDEPDDASVDSGDTQELPDSDAETDMYGETEMYWNNNVITVD